MCFINDGNGKLSLTDFWLFCYVIEIIGKRILNYRLTPLLFSGFLLESEHGAGSRARVVAGACG